MAQFIHLAAESHRRSIRESGIRVSRGGVAHEQHFVDVPDDVKAQLKQRSEALPTGSAWTTEAEFDAVTAHFQAPAEDEAFNVIRHERA